MKRASRFCSVLMGVIAAAVLLGWTANAETLTRVFPGRVAMNPATAVAFLLAAIALWLSISTAAPNHWRKRAALACATLVAAIGLLKCGTYLFGWKIPIDEFLFPARLHDTQMALFNRMAPNTAVAFLLGGLALGLLDWNVRGRWHPSEILSLIVGLLSLVAFTGYLLNTVNLYRVAAYIPMALPTALGFLTLAVGIIAARPERGFARLLGSSGAGGATLRRLLPAALAVPLLLALLRVGGERAGYFDVSLGVSLMVVATMAAFAALIFLNATALERADEARREAEEKIRQLNVKLKSHADQLENANKELEAFSYSVSHDLRAPLRAVDGFSNILLNKFSPQIPEDARRLVNVIVNSARQMGQLIDDLLRLSRLGRQSLTKQNVRIAGLVGDIVNELRHEHSGRQIDVRVGDLPDGLGDASLLKQVLVNLISNAFKFTRKRDKAEIEIGCRNENGEKIYYVRDNGTGFDMKYSGKLFGVFQRMHRAEDFEGTGVGLSIVHRIIQRHGGRVWAEAEVDKGATFYFSLPD